MKIKAQNPIIVSTRADSSSNQLLNVAFENHPPSDPDGDLDHDGGSVYDQRITISSSPLEITYDKSTVTALISLFKTPEEINLANLQQQAFAKLKEYQESTALSLQYVIENHNLIDVNIKFQSSFILIPHGGEFSQHCACSVLNLGKYMKEEMSTYIRCSHFYHMKGEMSTYIGYSNVYQS